MLQRLSPGTYVTFIITIIGNDNVKHGFNIFIFVKYKT